MESKSDKDRLAVADLKLTKARQTIEKLTRQLAVSESRFKMIEQKMVASECKCKGSELCRGVVKGGSGGTGGQGGVGKEGAGKSRDELIAEIEELTEQVKVLRCLVAEGEEKFKECQRKCEEKLSKLTTEIVREEEVIEKVRTLALERVSAQLEKVCHGFREEIAKSGIFKFTDESNKLAQENLSLRKTIREMTANAIVEKQRLRELEASFKSSLTAQQKAQSPRLPSTPHDFPPSPNTPKISILQSPHSSKSSSKLTLTIRRDSSIKSLKSSSTFADKMLDFKKLSKYR